MMRPLMFSTIRSYARAGSPWRLDWNTWTKTRQSVAPRMIGHGMFGSNRFDSNLRTTILSVNATVGLNAKLSDRVASGELGAGGREPWRGHT